MFMNYTLEHNEKPKSVYNFANLNVWSRILHTFLAILKAYKVIADIFFERTMELLLKMFTDEDIRYESKL
jgi:hypothetical protein